MREKEREAEMEKENERQMRAGAIGPVWPHVVTPWQNVDRSELCAQHVSLET